MSNGESFLNLETYQIEMMADAAINLSYESALKNGHDIPIGAVAVREAVIVGSGYASDKQNNEAHLHAEVVAIRDASDNAPEVILSTVEACILCQAAMMELPELKSFAYIVPRIELSRRGLVNPRPSMEERASRGEFNFEVVRLDDPTRYERAIAPLDHTTVLRQDDGSGLVVIDQARLLADQARFAD
ncbi:hypothetical protein BH10PAT4_BH10PAT4_4770 [soil metagenome]